MSGTADVERDLWADPWFVAVSVEAKALYLWALTTHHAHIGGLYMVARPLIEFETGLKASRFDKALRELDGKLLYDEPTGAVWVRGRAKRVRSKTEQVAKSIASALKKCPHPAFQAAFIDKYGDAHWLVKHESVAATFGEVQASLDRTSPEVHPSLGNGSTTPNSVNLTGTSPEVPSQRLGLGLREEPQTPRAGEQGSAKVELPAGLSGYLVPVADALRRVAAAKPGAITPTDAAVANALRDNAAKDFIPVTADFEHYWLHGTGQGKSMRDVVKTWRNFAQRQPDVSRKTPPAGPGGNGHGDRHDPVAMRAELQRRLAADEQ